MSATPSPISTLSNFDRKKAAIDKGRNLVICFDGTANEYTDRNTSIVKLFTFLEKVYISSHLLPIGSQAKRRV